MNKLVGRHLEEMADIRSTRKQKIVYSFSLISAALFIFYTWAYFQDGYYTLSVFEMMFVVIGVIDAIYIEKVQEPHYCEILLSCVLLIQGVVLFLYSGTIPERMLWLYPILAAVIFINEFRMGLILSASFLLFLGGLAALIPHKFVLPFNSTHRFSLSLVTMSAVCHVSSYYFTKAVGYIQRLYQEGIEDLAYRDQLTGLANRWSFERWAIEKLNTVNTNNSVTALVFLDIDNFKTINDSFGHDVGDSVLQHFAQRLKNNVRTKDRSTHKHDYSIARFAGDEFVLMLYDVKSKQDLDGILHRISGLFDNENLTNNQIGKLTLSIGVAMYPTDAKDLAELTRCADKAMYFAKHSGKNRFAYYQDNLTTPLIEDVNRFEPPKPIESIPSNVTALHQQSN